ncbi:MAG: MBL fold metallo-hydrolase [Methanocalculus sp. MSAO_Arc1]|uniref:MBL fold metallo-hydrolase n=1 Tax=Methanocalculus TaxID=71151 RepID=UPI000FF3027D|nr:MULTISPECIES: MBL fold metallo-hydrolase [unclassified Methanocalculus]MCP1662881.1 7,8-dihydropterin-6-yl-methyl-4-(beta-D-ribofuranosyl)aminobenzene 5'-phosphate synthase [Methanocalculus sp. AMF5]RQD80031.1 MAG: MBL fold metallo-hydrolase [Methanocalculus sp. MSAO_Arc1]
MQLSVLVENTTLIDRYYRGEPALSFFIEDGDTKILFDCGYSDIFLQNAEAMGINLLETDTIVLSHGHIDHTGGLPHLTAYHIRASSDKKRITRPVFLTHPATFTQKTAAEGVPVGCPLSPEYLRRFGEVTLTDKPLLITPRLLFLGEIPRYYPDRIQKSSAYIESPEGPKPDPVIEDSCLVYRSDRGLVLICGCTHAGIENTVRHARHICGDERIAAIIGGLHLYQADSARIREVAAWCAQSGVGDIYPCHCTGMPAAIALQQNHILTPIGVGTRLCWDSGEITDGQTLNFRHYE